MRGRWHGAPFHDFKTRKWLITFETDEKPEIYDSTSESNLNITIKKYRAKRSLNANNYFYALCNQLASVHRTSLTEVHNLMISRYGQLDREFGAVILRDDIAWESVEQMHLKPTGRRKVLDNGKVYQVYLVMRGSHTYDTKEMSILIDGVVSECKDAGIETLPPDEIERMTNSWKAS